MISRSKFYPNSGKKIAIFGAGGHAVSVLSVALASGYEPACFIDPRKAGDSLLDCPVIASLADKCESFWEGFSFAIGVGDNFVRQRIRCELDIPPERFPALIHPSAIISAHSEVDEGAIVMPLTVVGPNSRMGRFTILNTRASIDHDCDLEDFAAIAPAGVTGGRVRIGERSFVGMGAQVRHGLTIGADSVVGAGSYLNADLGCRVVAFGCPARVVRHREPGEPFL